MANPLYDRLLGQHAENGAVFLHLKDGTVLTYKNFVAKAAQYAHVLTDLGIGPGERVALQVDKSAEALAVIAGCIQAGIVFLPLNTGYTVSELSYFIENSGAKLVICGPDKETALKDLCAVEVLDQDGQGSLRAKADDAPKQFQTVTRHSDDLAALLYTSGTTGRSKGAMLSQDNLLSNAEMLVEEWQFTKEDVLLHALPIFHTHGLFVATNVMLLVGGQMIFLPKFDLDDMITQLPQATSLMGVPTFYTRLLGDPRFTKDLSAHMRLFISGSAPLLAETHVEFETRTGHRILERYGMTETNMSTSNPYKGERRAGTVGFPLPGVELKITDPETGKTVPQGDIGVLEVRGRNVFQGYWNMPEKTAEELRGDGFFITGDLGRLDADGYVEILGRNKDLIISGGLNIYPKELEEVLDQQTGVLESAVIGVAHPDFGESPVGVLVAKGGDKLNLVDIMEAISADLAKFKLPKKLVEIEALPRNTMGKVQKNILREQYRDLFA